MRSVIVTTAYQLFLDTVSLDRMDTDHPEFHNLYAKECQLFDLLRQMDQEESREYKTLTLQYQAKVVAMCKACIYVFHSEKIKK